MQCIFFFNDTATTEIYTLSLHDALPIWRCGGRLRRGGDGARLRPGGAAAADAARELPLRPRVRAPDANSGDVRSEEHTSELQSRQYLVWRLLLEKKYSSSPLKSFLT